MQSREGSHIRQKHATCATSNAPFCVISLCESRRATPPINMLRIMQSVSCIHFNTLIYGLMLGTPLSCAQHGNGKDCVTNLPNKRSILHPAAPSPEGGDGAYAKGREGGRGGTACCSCGAKGLLANQTATRFVLMSSWRLFCDACGHIMPETKE